MSYRDPPNLPPQRDALKALLLGLRRRGGGGGRVLSQMLGSRYVKSAPLIATQPPATS